jgi:ABC-type Na+ efflux pump permease subunit
MKRDWRDSVRLAADLALLGMLMSFAALPLVTAGAAVATGSAAIGHYLTHDRWPGPALCWRIFRRALLPGLAGTLGFGAPVTLLVLDVRALRSGLVPGGLPLIVLTVVVAAGALGYAGLALAGASVRGPREIASAAGVLTLAAVLALLVHPVLAPVLAGYTLFALHVLARRRAAPASAGDGQQHALTDA